MIELLFSLLVLAAVVGLVFYLLRFLSLPEPWGLVVQVLAALLALLLLLDIVFGGGWTGVSVRGRF